jgi:WD40 repeat protein
MEVASQAALREAYQARLAAAILAIGDGDTFEAARHLEVAPAALRGWEWQHLRQRLHDLEPSVVQLPLHVLHGNPVRLILEGQHVLTHSNTDNRARVFDSRSGRLRTEYLPGSRFLSFGTRAEPSVAFFEPGRPAVLIDQAGKTQRGHWALESNLIPTALSPDGTLLAIARIGARAPNDLEVRDSISGDLRFRVDRPVTPGVVTFSPDGARLAAACPDRTIRLWNAATGQPAGVLHGTDSTVRVVSFSPNGRRLLCAGDDCMLRQWDLDDGKLVDARGGHNQQILAAAFSPDGRWILTGSSDRTVRLWRSAGGEAVAVLRGHGAEVSGVAFHPDGITLVSADIEGKVCSWPSPVPADTHVLAGHTSYVYPVVYSPDGTWLASGGWDDVIRLWDAASGAPIGVLHGAKGYIAALAISPDGATIASLSRDEHLRIWDVATGAVRFDIADFGPIQGEPQTVAISPDGKLVACGAHNRVRMWDIATGQESAGITLPVKGDIRLAVFHPDGHRLAIVAADPVIYLVDGDSARILTTLEGHTAFIQAVSFSRDGRRLVSAGNDRTVRLWHASSGELQRTMAGHTEQIFAAVFHPDGTRVASAGRDRAIRIWDAATGDELARLQGHGEYVFSLAFSPDGSTLVSGSGDFSVRLWDTHPLITRRTAHGNLERAQPEADLVVDRLMKSGTSADQVLRQIQLDRSRDDYFRRAAWRAVLRRAL